MTTQWDLSVDLVIAGSGGGGMVAGLAALDCGLEPLVVEKQALVGGSTGLSGRIVWMPNNPLMRADGIADSHEDGLAYLADVVGDIGAPSSPERREMFLTAGCEMINFLVRKGVALIRCDGWSDYYPNHKGGNAFGRAVEGIPFDAAELGSWHDKVQPSLAKNYGYVVIDQRISRRCSTTTALRALSLSRPGFRAQRRGARPPARDTHQRRVADRTDAESVDHLGGGEPPLWTNAAMEDLIVEDGRVVGARIVHDGTTLNVEARRGVLLAAGGFGHNADMRRRYSGDQPNEAHWSIANAGDTGEVLQSAMRLGAKTDLLDEAWWLPSVFIAEGGTALRRWAPDASDPGPSMSTRRAADSATSPTPMSRSARRCTPTKLCRAG